jgi:thioredoxin 2
MDLNSIILKCNNCGTRNRVPKARLNEKPLCGKCGKHLSSPAGYDRPVDITDRTFEKEVIFYPGAVLVDCWAPWCGPCRMITPVLEQLAQKYAGKIKITKLNVEENPITASKYTIQSIPTMLLFKNGESVNRFVGALPKNEIEKNILSIIKG